MARYQAGLYILNYHEVSFEASWLIRGIGWNHAPDVFERHVNHFAAQGSLISLRDGLERLTSGGEFTEPTFAFWFDDGFTGVREAALPILDDFGITAGISICSRFVLRTEMYWHCKLSVLRHLDALPALRSTLRRDFGYDGLSSLKEWVHTNFRPEVREVISGLYDECTTGAFRDDAAEIFDDYDGIAELRDRGWIVANHTAAHHPMYADTDSADAAKELRECADLIERIGGDPEYLVVPFSCAYPAYTPLSYYRSLGFDGTVVDVGDRHNSPKSFSETGILYRCNPDWRNAKSTPF